MIILAKYQTFGVSKAESKQKKNSPISFGEIEAMGNNSLTKS